MVRGRRLADAKGESVDAVGTPNEEHINVWNEILVPKFRRFRHILVGGFEGHSRLAMEKHRPALGQSALDVGCGFGETTLELARLVGPSGRALGIDCCDAFVDTGRGDAKAAGVDNVRFSVADAQTERFEPEYDHCFSRFGTMFFASPVQALRNLRTALRPGGRLVMIVWRTLDDNEWVALPKGIVRDRLPKPAEQGPTCGPGPFSMADSETVESILASSGWTDVGFERVDVPVTVGTTPEEAATFQLQIGPAGELMREAGEVAEQRRTEIEAALRAALEPYRTPRGVVLRSSSWTITARNPG